MGNNESSNTNPQNPTISTTKTEENKNNKINETTIVKKEENKIEMVLVEEEDDEMKDSKMIICFKNLYGMKKKIDEEKAKKICIEASKNGDPLAEAMMIFKGWHLTIQNSIKALECCEELVKNKAHENKEESYCHLLMGLIHSSGKGIDKNIKKSKNSFEISAKKENCIAMYFLALLLIEENKDEKKNQESAIKWLEKSSQMGHILSYKKLAEIYLESGNYIKAKNIFESLVQIQDLDAINILANMYIDGRISKNIMMAKELLQQGVNLGFLF